MKRLVTTLLVATLILSSPLCAQTIEISLSDWLLLRQQLQTSKQQLAILDVQVATLQSSLQIAKESSGNSKQKIIDLQGQLEEASRQQGILQQQVATLETRLLVLGRLLNDTKSQISINEEARIKQINDLTAQYDRKALVQKITIWALIIGIVGETAYVVISKAKS